MNGAQLALQDNVITITYEAKLCTKHAPKLWHFVTEPRKLHHRR